MDYNTLLELTADLGYRLAMNGAETFRVEESASRILKSYGLKSEVFAIPNCLIVSIETPDGRPMTRMRRIGYHGNDLDSVERYNNLSRRICAQRPEPKEAIEWMRQTDKQRISYGIPGKLLGHFLGSAGFAVFFGSSLTDSLFSGLAGILVGLISILLDKYQGNRFFRTILSSFVMSLFVYLLTVWDVVRNADSTIIGALMLLVPGLLFTNAMRDIIYGDTNSGINRIVQVFLVAIAIVLGTAAAWNVTCLLTHTPVSVPAIAYSMPVQLVACCVGCLGFAILFNIHGPGIVLCVIGGVLAWASYLLTVSLHGSELFGYFIAAATASLYSEIMARIRKYPAISYLVVGIFPLIPGASVYYTMNCALQGDMQGFSQRGMLTIGIAGVIAVGLLMISTFVRMLSNRKQLLRK